MSLFERLLQTLCCPHDQNELRLESGELICASCGRTFAIDRGIVRFINEDSQRPQWSRALLDAINRAFPEMHAMDYYRDRFSKAEKRYRENAALRRVVDELSPTVGVAVDIASGPGGGFLPLLASRLPSETLLIGTDACPPIIEHWSTCISRSHPLSAYLDIDLLQPLPFPDASLDLVTGVFIENVNIDEPMGLISELSRCTKPEATIVLRQLFYADESATAAMLRDQSNPYASVSDFARSLASVGLVVADQTMLRFGRGKLDPGDAFPIGDTDEWAESILTVAHA